MSKKPMKFLPPDDPTAVYAIGSMKTGKVEEAEVAPPETPAPEPPAAPTPAPEPAAVPAAIAAAPPAAAGLNPLVLLAFLAGGMLLAAGVLAALALLLYLFQ